MAMSPKRYCRAHSRKKPCESCAQGAVKQKLLWSATSPRMIRQHQIMANRPDAWLPSEEEVVRNLAGTMAVDNILDEINKTRAKYYLPLKTSKALRVWAQYRGISLLMATHIHSRAEAAWLLGVTEGAMRSLHDLGYLVGVKWGFYFTYSNEDLQKFISEYPWLIDNDRLRSAVLKNSHQLSNQRDPWLKVPQVAGLCGIGRKALLKYIREGRVEAKQRPGSGGSYMIKASHVPSIMELPEEYRERSLVNLEKNHKANKAA